MQLSYFELIPFLFHSEQASLILRRTVKGILQSVSSRAVGQENDLHVMIVLSTLPTPSPPALLQAGPSACYSEGPGQNVEP